MGGNINGKESNLKENNLAHFTSLKRKYKISYALSTIYDCMGNCLGGTSADRRNKREVDVPSCYPSVFRSGAGNDKKIHVSA